MSDVNVQKNRIWNEFEKLVSFDSETYHERALAKYVKEKLRSLGLEVREDWADKTLAEKHHSHDTASNIYAYLKGKLPGEPILFTAHLDTVSPGTNKKAILHADGRITSAGNSVLGADDAAGIVDIIEALQVIRENDLPHRSIEVLITASEETYCEGSRYLEPDRLHSKRAYVLDLEGPIGRVANRAPSILSITVKVGGKAAHAGFAPEQGVNALTIVTEALHQLPAGRIDENTTVNFGIIHGGNGRNIVPDHIEILGEIRSLDHRQAMETLHNVEHVFGKISNQYGGVARVEYEERIHSYHVDEKSATLRQLYNVIQGCDRCIKPECVTTFGGSDANRLNQLGIEAVVLACGMNKCHTTQEYTTLDDLMSAAELTLRLMTTEDTK